MEGKANLAGVVRNHEGTGLLAWLNRIGACTSELAEALAMSRGSAKGRGGVGAVGALGSP